MATNYVATEYQGLSVSQQVGDNLGQWTPFANPTFVINDILYLIQIPNFVVLYGFFIDLPQLDTGTALLLDIGDNITTTSAGVGSAGYFSSTTAGRAGTAGQNNIQPGNITGYVHGSLPKTYSISNANVPTAGTALGTTATGAPAGIWLTMKVHTAAQTATTTGSIYGWAKYQSLSSTAGAATPAL